MTTYEQALCDSGKEKTLGSQNQARGQGLGLAAAFSWYLRKVQIFWWSTKYSHFKSEFIPR